MSVQKALQMVDDLVKLVDDDEHKQADSDDDSKYVMGLDSSTQSLTVSIYDISPKHNFRCIVTVNINFDAELGQKYGVKNGVIENKEELEVTAPTLMFIEALDIALNRLQTDHKLDFSKIVSISGSGQQHGSVYWKNGARKILQNMDSSQTLLENLKDAFAIYSGPIWMDSSTTKQCRELETKIGSPWKVSQISGSRAYERFTGNQIAKISQLHHDVYSEMVERISLVSSFMCSLFLGDYAPIDVSDGSGMNLLDINKQQWSMILCECTAPGLQSKLGEKVANSYDCVGNVSTYFVEKYGFNPKCCVVAFSGDNPCSLAGLMCYEQGDICVSLGTSDTLFAVTNTPKPQNEGHVLCSPIHEKAYMILLCYKNGSISRENIKKKYFPNSNKDWSEFNKQLLNAKENGGAGNQGRLAFYYDHAEILPTVKPGLYRFDEHDNAVDEYKDDGKGAQDIRGIIESQFMAMRQHMEKFGVQNSSKILATGGASKNDTILQVLADVFGANVYRIDSPDSASKGAALRALHGYKCRKANTFVSFKEIVDSVGGPNYALATKPNEANTKIYTELLPRRAKLEDTLPRL
eukprot:CAMPEP_0197036814 /NCGR_PEP_ID=MMETSP1384-20130603/14203_1 /TAXON_ID=29189 /ORGANISM="Ammonia sp." /LENGTH=578 /DNA_ID=CAMNT_0042467031 /DNA_START=20 /DNA_END=1756 /DNA_ORIENTATION=-